MNSCKKLLIAGAALAASSFVSAAPVQPLDFHSGLNTGFYTGASNDVDGVNWFVFDFDGIGTIDFWFDRTEASPDLYASLYLGDTTGFDYVAAGAGSSFSQSQAGHYNSDITYLNSWDDIHEDSHGGPWGDPHFSYVGTAGTYSLALSSYGQAGSYEFTTNMQSGLSPVPVPAAAWLFGTALVGFAGWRRRQAK